MFSNFRKVVTLARLLKGEIRRGLKWATPDFSGKPETKQFRQLAKNLYIAHRPRIGPIHNQCHQYGA